MENTGKMGHFLDPFEFIINTERYINFSGNFPGYQHIIIFKIGLKMHYKVKYSFLFNLQIWNICVKASFVQQLFTEYPLCDTQTLGQALGILRE